MKLRKKKLKGPKNSKPRRKRCSTVASPFLLADFDGDLSSIAERSDEDNVSDTEIITSEEDEEQVPYTSFTERKLIGTLGRWKPREIASNNNEIGQGEKVVTF